VIRCRALAAVIGIAAVAAGCASAGPAGPDAAALAALIGEARSTAAPTLSGVTCDFIEEEGSEWACAYRERAADGRWMAQQTYVAPTGDGWVLIDTPADPNATSIED
jgi:hypothetical protein